MRETKRKSKIEDLEEWQDTYMAQRKAEKKKRNIVRNCKLLGENLEGFGGQCVAFFREKDTNKIEVLTDDDIKVEQRSEGEIKGKMDRVSDKIADVRTELLDLENK